MQARRRLLSDLGLDAGGRIRRLCSASTLPPSQPYQTFAGFLLQEFGAIPGVGDKIEADGWRFEIVDLDGRRIDKVLASRWSTHKRRPGRIETQRNEIVRLL